MANRILVLLVCLLLKSQLYSAYMEHAVDSFIGQYKAKAAEILENK